jgi:antitoxin (DNA-binding transcriptional repressor) of toxin-antitoxin stability system
LVLGGDTVLIYDIEEFKERFEELIEKAAAGEAFEVSGHGQSLVLVKAIDPEADLIG